MLRGALAAVAGVVGGLVLAGCGGSSAVLPLPCTPQTGGALCLKVFHDGSTVQDAIGYLAVSKSPLAGKTWRLVVTASGHTYPGRTRRGNPPAAITCKPPGWQSECYDRLASDYASMGDFGGFSVPARVASGAQVCISEQIRTGRVWATQEQPASACSGVS